MFSQQVWLKLPFQLLSLFYPPHVSPLIPIFHLIIKADCTNSPETFIWNNIFAEKFLHLKHERLCSSMNDNEILNNNGIVRPSVMYSERAFIICGWRFAKFLYFFTVDEIQIIRRNKLHSNDCKIHEKILDHKLRESSKCWVCTLILADMPKQRIEIAAIFFLLFFPPLSKDSTMEMIHYGGSHCSSYFKTAYPFLFLMINISILQR